MVSYCRCLIRNFNKAAHPLHSLLEDDSDSGWRPRHSQAVRDITQPLKDAAALQIFDPDKLTLLRTDASKQAMR